MATESRVVPSASFSALGEGKTEDLDEVLELKAAHHESEEEFDEKNDETFGAADFNDDWEVDHERFAQEEGSGFFGFNNFGPSGKSIQAQNGAGLPAGHDEEFMEQTIKHLVVDDELDDPAILNASKGRHVPRKPNVDDLFGPASPPALLDTEHLLSASRRTIWDPPQTEGSHSANQLRVLFDFAKSDGKPPGKMPVGVVPTSHAPGAGGQPRPGSTLEEVERQLLRGNQMGAQTTAGPRVLNAADLERQLRGETAPLPPPPSSLPLPPGLLPAPRMAPPGVQHQPPHPPSMPQPIPGALEARLPHSLAGPHVSGLGNLSTFHRQPPGLSAMARRLSDGRMSPMAMMASSASSHTPPSQNRQSPLAQNMRHSPALGMSPTLVALGRTTPTPTPLNFGASPPVSRSPLPGPGMVSPYTFMAGSPSAGRIYPTPGPGPGPFVRNQALPGQFPGPRMPPPPMLMGPNTPHALMRGLHPRHIANFNQHQSGPAGQTDPRLQQPRGPPPFGHHFPRSQAPHPSQGSLGGGQTGPSQGEDDYCGLMTQREKDWIIKIQLMQLQTDNPQLDDYYYTRFMLRKKTEERQKLRENGLVPEDSEPALLMPALVKVESKAYTPAHFEGSLGRLTTASVHNPRHIIDVKRSFLTAATEEGSAGKNVSKELRRFRQLLMDIEKGFNVLLEVDDCEKQLLALPEESRGQVFMHRKEKIEELFKYFTSDDNFENFMQALTVRKGRKLLARSLPLFDKAQAQVIVSLALLNVPNLIKKDLTSKDQVPDESLLSLGQAVSVAIEHTEFEALAKYAEFLQKESTLLAAKPLQAILQNKFGCLLVCSLLQRGEDIYLNTSPVDMEEQSQNTWCLFVEEFADTLDAIASTAVVRPDTALTRLEPHLTRILHPKVLSRIEDKVALLTTPTSSS